MTANMNFENRTIFHADNLSVLRGMNSATIDLIATTRPSTRGVTFTLPRSRWRRERVFRIGGLGTMT